MFSDESHFPKMADFCAFFSIIAFGLINVLAMQLKPKAYLTNFSIRSRDVVSRPHSRR